MKVTKFVHSCVLVETPQRVAMFDPGGFSVGAVDVSLIERLDDILITHAHPDHMDPSLIKQLTLKFPQVKITGTSEVRIALGQAGITSSDQAPDYVKFFKSPHEPVEPIFPQPEEHGMHFMDVFTHPGDSHSFKETKSVLALPISGPWGSTIKAASLAMKLKPKYVIPIHDWHMKEESRLMFYDILEKFLGEQGISFLKVTTGQPVEIPTNDVQQ